MVFALGGPLVVGAVDRSLLPWSSRAQIHHLFESMKSRQTVSAIGGGGLNHGF